MEWKSIDTAPMDGASPVIAFGKTPLGPRQAVAQYIHWEGGKSNWCLAMGDGFIRLGFTPTHWMPLITPTGAYTMTTSPLAAIDALLDPMLQAANRVRQVRDSLPEPMWRLVPAVLRDPMDALFMAVEAYDRKIGLLREAGFMPAKDLTPGE